jgi:formamidopyrimidine-DNA glycosylase
MHLRMTGNLQLRRADLEEARHLRAVIRLEGGDELWFTDARRFGHATVLEGEALDDYLDERLGIEPLSDELTAEALLRLADGRTAPLKSFLLAQEGVAGIGNIYADEALHIAGLHPLSPAGSMKAEHAQALRAGIVTALEAGLASGGASIDDYRDARGERGSMQDEFLVHTREGRDCPRCGETIRRVVVSGRSTYFCPGCQVRLRRRPRRRKRAAR